MPTRWNRGFYCRSYCLLNMFRASLCPSSGAQEYYTVVAACGILCCGFSSSWSGVELLHLVGISFPHINEDARSKSHQISTLLIFKADHRLTLPWGWREQIPSNYHCVTNQEITAEIIQWMFAPHHAPITYVLPVYAPLPSNGKKASSSLFFRRCSKAKTCWQLCVFGTSRKWAEYFGI